MKFLLFAFSCCCFSNVFASKDTCYSIEEALQNKHSTTTLILESSYISNIPNDINLLPNLVSLKIITFKFTQIPSAIYKLKGLKNLTISGASYTKYESTFFLKSISDSIALLQNLEVLDLSHNDLTYIPKSLLKMKHLKKLILWDNLIDSTSALKDIFSLPTLEYLDLSANNITHLPDSLQNNSIKELILDNLFSEGVPVGDGFSSFPESLFSLIYLERLSLSGHSFSYIPKGISALTNLNSINLFANGLKEFPSSLCSLSKIEDINLDVICIGETLELCELPFLFPEEIFQLKTLKRVELSSRNISYENKQKLIEGLPNCKFPYLN